MNPGSQKEVVDAILDRFREGKGATLQKPYLIGRGVEVANLTIYLCPLRLCDDSSKGLLIVVEERGSYVWDGAVRLSKFKLISAGIKPIALAEDLAFLCNSLAETLEAVQIQSAKTPALIEYKGT